MRHNTYSAFFFFFFHGMEFENVASVCLSSPVPLLLPQWAISITVLFQSELYYPLILFGGVQSLPGISFVAACNSFYTSM